MRLAIRFVLCSAIVLYTALATAQRAQAQSSTGANYVVKRLTDRLYAVTSVIPLTPDGRNAGNNLVLVGDDAALVVDGDYSDNATGFRDVVRSITGNPIRMVINTHWHNDHAGTNESLAREGAVIVAQKNTRKRVMVDNYLEDVGVTLPALPEAGWPVVTFSHHQTIHFAGEQIDAFHEIAHTDSDAVLYFRKANVVHMGDIYFHGLFPFFDRSTGGGIDGMIAACRRVLDQIDDQTVVVSGHGDLGNKRSLRDYTRMLEESRHRVKRLIRAGLSLDEVVAAKPLADLESTWGWFFIPTDLYTTIIYKSLTVK